MIDLPGLVARVLGPASGADPGARRHDKALLNFLGNTGNKICFVLYGVISIPLLLRYFGEERYGILAVLINIITYIQLCNFGMHLSLLNAVADARGKEETETLGSIVSTANLYFTPIPVAIGLVLTFLLPLLPLGSLFGLTSPALVAETGHALYVVIWAAVFHIIFANINAAQQAFQEDYLGNLWSILSTVLKLGSIPLVFMMEGDLVTLLLAFLLTNILTNGLNIWQFFRRHPECLPSLKNASGARFRPLIVNGLLFFLLSLSSHLSLGTLDNLIIASSLGAAAVAGYSIVTQITGILMNLINTVTLAYWAPYAEAQARGDHAWIRRTYDLLVVVTGAMAALAACTLAVWGKDILSLWIGNRIDISPTLIRGFAVYLLIVVMMSVNGVLLNAMNRLKEGLFVNFTDGLLNVVLSLWFVRIWGVEGVMLATLIPSFFFNLVASSVAVWRVTGGTVVFPVADFLKGVAVPGAVILGVNLAVSGMLGQSGPVLRLAAAAICFAAGGAWHVYPLLRRMFPALSRSAG